MAFVGKVAASDPTGDLVHETGKSDDRPRYVDIEEVTGTADGLTLDLAMTLRAEPPTTRSNAVERLRYYFALDTTGDGKIDYVVDLENYSDGTFRAAVDGWNPNLPLGPRAETFTIMIDGRRVSASVPLSTLQSPSAVQFCAFAMSAVPEGAPIFVKDYAPDGWCEGGGTEPVMIQLT